MSIDSDEKEDLLAGFELSSLSAFDLGDLFGDCFAHVDPEAMLWASVIKTYFDDAKHLRIKNWSRARFYREAEALLNAAAGPDALWICDLVGIDHGYVVRKLYEVLFEKDYLEGV